MAEFEYLNESYVDDILASTNTARKYLKTDNEDGTISLEDKTEYDQNGTPWGAGDVNKTNKSINDIYRNRIQTLEEANLVTEPGFFVDAKVIPEINKKIESKNDLIDGEFKAKYLTINTSYDDRVEALKYSLVNNTTIYPEGITIAYIVSSNSDDRGMAIIMKKATSDGQLRLAFQYWDYWGKHEFWCYTNSGWSRY